MKRSNTKPDGDNHQKSRPLITVIIPVYNTEKWLRHCLNSVRRQTMKELEILLVNDGSTDNSLAVCREAAASDSRIRVLSQPNRGLSAARNTGIEASHGRFLTFLDSDDYWEPDFCESLYKLALQHDAALVISNYDYVDENGKQLPRTSPIRDEVFTGREGLGKLQGPDYYYYIIQCARLFDRRLFAHVRYPEGRLREDEFTAHKLFYLSPVIASTSRQLYHYVQHTGSIMSGHSVRTLDGLEAACRRVVFYQKHGMPDYAAAMEYNLRTMYCYDRYHIRIRSLADWKRAHEADRLYRKYLPACGGQVTGKDRLRFLLPDVCYLAMRLKLRFLS